MQVAPYRLSAALALYDAAARGDASQVIHLLGGNTGVVGDKGRNGMTALAVAAMNGHGGVVKVLLHFGAQPDAEQPLLCLAIGGAHANDNVEQYFGPGDAEAAGGEADGADSDGELAEGEPVSFARDAADVVSQLISKGANVEQQSSTGMTPLVLAALSGQANIVDTLIAAECSVNRQTESGITAVLAAAAGGHPDIISSLVRAGGDVNCPNEAGRTPLHVAVMRRHRAAVARLLAPGASCKPAWVDATDASGKTPLLWAAGGQHYGVFQEIMRTGADASIADYDGCTPLLAAIRGGEGCFGMAVGLLTCSQVQAYVNSADKTGTTALHLAAKTRQNMLVETLLDKGADPTAESKAHRLPIDMLGSDEVTTNAAGKSPVGRDEQALESWETKTVRGLLERAVTAAELVGGSGLKDILQGISVVAVLLVTVTFVGVLNPPGGPTPDSGYVR